MFDSKPNIPFFQYFCPIVNRDNVMWLLKKQQKQINKIQIQSFPDMLPSFSHFCCISLVQTKQHPIPLFYCLIATDPHRLAHNGIVAERLWLDFGALEVARPATTSAQLHKSIGLTFEVR